MPPELPPAEDYEQWYSPSPMQEGHETDLDGINTVGVAHTVDQELFHG